MKKNSVQDNLFLLFSVSDVPEDRLMVSPADQPVCFARFIPYIRLIFITMVMDKKKERSTYFAVLTGAIDYRAILKSFHTWV